MLQCIRKLNDTNVGVLHRISIHIFKYYWFSNKYTSYACRFELFLLKTHDIINMIIYLYWPILPSSGFLSNMYRSTAAVGRARYSAIFWAIVKSNMAVGLCQQYLSQEYFTDEASLKNKMRPFCNDEFEPIDKVLPKFALPYNLFALFVCSL